MTVTADKLAEVIREMLEHCDASTDNGLLVMRNARRVLADYEREKKQVYTVDVGYTG